LYPALCHCPQGDGNKQHHPPEMVWDFVDFQFSFNFLAFKSFKAFKTDSSINFIRLKNCWASSHSRGVGMTNLPKDDPDQKKFGRCSAHSPLGCHDICPKWLAGPQPN
jgi:hypothetical protein